MYLSNYKIQLTYVTIFFIVRLLPSVKNKRIGPRIQEKSTRWE